MKKEYVKPLLESETFIPNEYIAVCLTLYCAYPGTSPWRCHDGDKVYQDEEGMWHGAPCANGSYYNPDHQFEIENPSAEVYNVYVNGQIIDKNTNYDQFKPNKEYPAKWISNNGNEYKHQGMATVDKTSNHS